MSEPDRGQSNAINKGFRNSSGDIIAFLNSDDLYEPGTLNFVANFFVTHPDAMWVSGECKIIDENDRDIRLKIKEYKNFFLRMNNFQILKIMNYVSQPSTFWRRDALTKVGFLDESLYYTMDYDYWLRLGNLYPLFVIDKPLAKFRIHTNSKSGKYFHKQFLVEYQVASRYVKGPLLWLHWLHQYATIFIYYLFFYRKS